MNRTKYISWIFSTIFKYYKTSDYQDFASKTLIAYKQLKMSPMYKSTTLIDRLLILAEDHRFSQHCGVDCKGIARAIYKYFLNGKVEGASTIEQQLVRTISGRYERTISRKLREAWLALCISQLVPKEDIPGLYLYLAYFGYRMNGLKAALERLNIDFNSINIEEAAKIVALIKYPQQKNNSAKRQKVIDRRVRHITLLHYAKSSYLTKGDQESKTDLATC